MGDLETLKALLERVEKAEGPNIELEWAIHVGMNGIARVGMYGKHPNYTASVDAAFALIDQFCPALHMEISRQTDKLWLITYAFSLNDDGDEIWCDDLRELPRPPALAILEILLRALIAKKEADNG